MCANEKIRRFLFRKTTYVSKSILVHTHARRKESNKKPSKTFFRTQAHDFLKHFFDELLRTIPPTPHLHYFVAQSSWKIIMDHLARTRNCSHRHCRAPYVGVTRDHNQNQSYVVPMHPLPGCGKKKKLPFAFPSYSGSGKGKCPWPEGCRASLPRSRDAEDTFSRGNICQKSVS